MDCPKCARGKIRVIVPIACSCGHHPVVCDACAQQFTVPCGDPYGEAALPPDLSLTEDHDHRKAYERMIATIGDTNAPSYEESFRQAIEADPEYFPLLEDFKASLTG